MNIFPTQFVTAASQPYLAPTRISPPTCAHWPAIANQSTPQPPPGARILTDSLISPLTSRTSATLQLHRQRHAPGASNTQLMGAEEWKRLALARWENTTVAAQTNISRR